MKRKLLGIVAAVSVLLLIWACIAWATSYGPGASATPSTFATQARLSRMLPNVQFDQVGLSDVIDFLRDVSGQNIFVNWPALDKARIDRNTMVTSRYVNLPFGEAIARIIVQAGDLRYATQDNLLVIAPKEQLSRTCEPERLPVIPGPADVAMRKPLPEVVFSSVALEDTLTYLAQQTGTAISIDWRELRNAGVEPDAPVQLAVRRMPAATVLGLVLSNLNAKENLQFHVGKSEVLISTSKALDSKLGSQSGPGVLYALIAATMVVAIGIVGWIVYLKKRREAIRHYWGWIASTGVILMALIVAGVTYKHGPPFWEKASGLNRWTLTARHGELRLWHSPADPAAPYQDLAHLGHAKAADEQKLFDRAGFLVRWSGSPFNCWVAGMPLWGFVVLTAILPSLWLALAIRRWRRYDGGLCAKCGYDLRFSTDRCPECGSPIPAEAFP